MQPQIYSDRALRPVSGGASISGGVQTHGQIIASAGQTAAGDLSIGTITLPAGGPWIVHDIFCMHARATITAGEASGGSFNVISLDGDVDPNPAPSRFPMSLLPAILGATGDVQSDKLNSYPVDWTVPGKGRLEFIVNEPTANTVAPQYVMGIFFGKSRPVAKPIRFIDRVRAAITSAADTSVGTITLAEKAKKITWVGGTIAQDGVLVTAEELLGFFRLSSDDLNMAPAQFPFSAAYSAGLGALINQAIGVPPVLIPVDIDVIGGARIDCFCDLNTAVTNGAEVMIFVAYE